MTATEQPMPPRSAKRRKGSGRPRRFLPAAAVLALAVLLFLGCYFAYLYFFRFDSLLDRISASAAEENVEAAAQPSVKEKPLTFLLMGLDSRPQAGSLNTDVIMVAAFNPALQAGAVVSVSRDTYIGPAMGFHGNKANAFYPNFVVDNPATADCNIKQLFGQQFGIPIDYMATINFKGFQEVIDALGGITVDVDMDMRYVDEDDGTNINLKKGLQRLDGKQALDFVRYRKSNMGTAESSDLARNERQQKMVAELLDKLKSPGGLLKLGEVIDAVGDNLKTDMPKVQIKDAFATYMGMDKDKIQYIHLEGEWKSPYVLVPEEEWARAREALALILR